MHCSALLVSDDRRFPHRKSVRRHHPGVLLAILMASLAQIGPTGTAFAHGEDKTSLFGSAPPVYPTTTIPSPTTTIPSPTTTIPSHSSIWPGPSNTGVPTQTVLAATGSMNVTQPGTILDLLDISGSLTISANNVTVKRSRIRAEAFNVVQITDGVTGTILEDCSIDGRGATEGNNGVMGTATVRRCEIQGVENGIVPGSGSVVDASYIHGLLAPGEPHYDGIQIDGDKSNILIQSNTVDVGFGQTSAVMIDNYFGPISNITVDDNVLGGGGYTVYVDARFNSNPISGVSVTNNRITRGYWGYILVANASPHVAGNTDSISGAPLGQ